MTIATIIPNEPIDQYHGRDFHTLGSTRIKDFLENGPRWWKLRYIDGEIPDRDSDALKQGRMIDCLLTEPDKFADLFAVLPDDAPRKPSRTQREAKKPSPATVSAIAWWDKWLAENGEKDQIPADWCQTASDCAEAVRKHKTAAAMLDTPGVRSQVSVRAELGNWLSLQCRPDFLWLDEERKRGWYIDLKKTDDLSSFGRRAIDFGYHTQLGLAQWLLARAGYRIDAFLLAVEWQRGARCKLFSMSDAVLDHGWQTAKAAVDDIAERIASNYWEDDADDVEGLEVPGWLLAKMGVRQ